MSERFMKSIYKIIWSDEALRNLKSIIDYLENRWTEKEIGKFSKLLDRNLQIIEASPFLFPISDDFQNIRKAVLSPQTTIYYQIVDKEIHLISLFDNRQNPEKLKFKL